MVFFLIFAVFCGDVFLVMFLVVCCSCCRWFDFCGAHNTFVSLIKDAPPETYAWQSETTRRRCEAAPNHLEESQVA